MFLCNKIQSLIVISIETVVACEGSNATMTCGEYFSCTSVLHSRNITVMIVGMNFWPHLWSLCYILDNHAIKVYKANYGRSDMTTCSAGFPICQVFNKNCTKSDSLTTVVNRYY